MEEFREVKTVKVDYKCPRCKQGYLRPTGQCFATNPPLYPHKCTHCEYGETFNTTYPYVDYR